MFHVQSLSCVLGVVAGCSTYNPLAVCWVLWQMFHVQSLSCVLGVMAGCSTYSAFPDSDGVKPKDDISSCVAQSGAPVSNDPAQKSGVCFCVCVCVCVCVFFLKTGKTELRGFKRSPTICKRQCYVTGLGYRTR